MHAPIVHQNGTSPEALIGDLCTARSAILAAVDLLKHTAPNGRDYYLQEAQVFNAAIREHQIRGRRLLDTAKELQQLAIAISEQTA